MTPKTPTFLFLFLLYSFSSALLNACDHNATLTQRSFPTECPKGYAEVGIYDRCLVFHEKPLHLFGAHSTCLEDGGALAYAERGMPGFDKMAEVVQSKSSGSPVRVWHDNFKDKHQWDFKNGRCLSFPDEECVTQEFEKLPFFCEYYRVNPCESGWHYRDGQCFKIVISKNGGFTFDEAREACKALGNDVDLADINSLAKNELVKHFVTKQLDCISPPNDAYSWDRAWIGLQVVDHKLVLLNGEPANEELMKEDEFSLTYPWKLDSSLRSNDVQKCVHFDHLNNWKDFDCSRKNGFAVCGRKYPS